MHECVFVQVLAAWRFGELFIWNSRSELHAEAPGLLLKEGWLLSAHRPRPHRFLCFFPEAFAFYEYALFILLLIGTARPPFLSNLHFRLNAATEAKT